MLTDADFLEMERETSTQQREHVRKWMTWAYGKGIENCAKAFLDPMVAHAVEGARLKPNRMGVTTCCEWEDPHQGQ